MDPLQTPVTCQECGGKCLPAGDTEPSYCVLRGVVYCLPCVRALWGLDGPRRDYDGHD